MPPDRAPAVRRAVRLSPARLAPVVVLAGIMILVFAMGWHRHLSLETLVRHRAALGEFVAAHYAIALLAFIGAYVAVVSLSIPGSLILTITAGLLFGAVVGGTAVWIAANIGATIIFLIARSAFSDFVVRRAGPRLGRIVDGFCADAFRYLVLLRLVPLFPFFLVNLAPALVGVRLPVFLAATAIGIVPATFAFALVGAGLDSLIQAPVAKYEACVASGQADCRLEFGFPDLLTPEFVGSLIALTLLALVPVAAQRVFMRRADLTTAERGCGPDA
jgi:uncharacterized membrane protein YdjX (TVP38/TMEM64 family)